MFQPTPEYDLLAHLNDVHGCDFLEIARKLATPTIVLKALTDVGEIPGPEHRSGAAKRKRARVIHAGVVNAAKGMRNILLAAALGDARGARRGEGRHSLRGGGVIGRPARGSPPRARRALLDAVTAGHERDRKVRGRRAGPGHSLDRA